MKNCEQNTVYLRYSKHYHYEIVKKISYVKK